MSPRRPEETPKMRFCGSLLLAPPQQSANHPVAHLILMAVCTRPEAQKVYAATLACSDRSCENLQMHATSQGTTTSPEHPRCIPGGPP